jgi:hypothetical protein
MQEELMASGKNLQIEIMDGDGNVVATDEISSFGPPASVALSADRASIAADGRDLVYVTASIADASGNLVADSEAEVTFKVTGHGRLVGTDNGNTVDYDSYQSPIRKAFSGKVVAIVQSDGTPGQITVTAEGDGLAGDSVTVSAARDQAVAEIALAGIDGIGAIASPRGTLAMIAAIQPSGADYEAVSYAVSEPDGSPTDKAVIDKNGALTALKNGQVKVTATAMDGSGASGSADVAISGQQAFTPASAVTVSAMSGAIEKRHGTLQMSADVAPADASAKGVAWSVEGAGSPPAAEISNSGLLQAKYNGLVTVRATATDGSGAYGEFAVEISLQNTLATRDPYTATLAADYAAKQGDAIAEEADGAIGGIAAGNSLTYGQFAFGKAGSQEISITAATPGEAGGAGQGAVPIELRLGDPNGQLLATLPFEKTGDYGAFAEMAFAIPAISGNRNVCFVFPEGQVRLKSFVFSRPPARDPYSAPIYATAYDSTTSPTVFQEGEALGGFMPGDTVTYERLDFGDEGATKIKMSICAPGSGTPLEIYLGGPNGQLIATIALTQAGGTWGEYTEKTYTVPLITGIEDVCFKLPNGGFQFKWFVFAGASAKPSSRDPYISTEAASYHEKIGGGVAETPDGAGVGGFGAGDSVTYHYFAFGDGGAAAIRIFGSNAGSQPVPIRLHLVGAGGPVLGTVQFPPTEGAGAFVGATFAVPRIAGEQTISFEFPEGGPFVLRDFSFMPPGYAVRDPYSVTVAATFDGTVGGGHEEQGGVGGFGLGDGLIFKGFEFGSGGSQKIRFTGSTAADSRPVEIRDGGASGALLASFQFASTGGWGEWVTREYDIPGISGDIDLCFLFPDGSMQIRDFQFIGRESALYIDVGEAGAVTARADYIPGAGEPAGVTLLLALYSADGRLVALNEASAASAPYALSVSLGKGSAAYAKAFLWDSATFAPVLAAKTLAIG